MLLQSSEQNNNNMQQQQSHQSFVNQHMPPAPHSAPANIVFQNIQSPYPLPSPAELDFDEMSPLTSPWLGAYNTNPPVNPSRQMQHGSSAGTKRRTASPGSDELSASGRPSRKRQAAVNRMQPNMGQMGGHGGSKKSNLRGTKSASSTPLFPAVAGASRGSGSRRSGPSPADIPGDTPSPVDLSMPPPATPQPLAPMNFLQSGSSTSETTPAPTPTPQEHITPVTPASIMNLGRLGQHGALAPPPQPQSVQIPNRTQDKATRSRASSRPRSATVNGQASGSRGSLPTVSPALKPIRPGE